MKERRKHIRLSLVINAEFKLIPGIPYMGKTKNIGLGGLFVSFKDKPLIKIGDRCSISLLLYKQNKQVALQCQCKVIHQNKDGIGFKFHSVDFAYLDHLKELLRLYPNSIKLAEDIKRQSD